jgi:hypothetical protein
MQQLSLGAEQAARWQSSGENSPGRNARRPVAFRSLWFGSSMLTIGRGPAASAAAASAS